MEKTKGGISLCVQIMRNPCKVCVKCYYRPVFSVLSELRTFCLWVVFSTSSLRPQPLFALPSELNTAQKEPPEF
uniref:Uncharacterized protein n=1 Tax=Anguilla anguilla TaxID=7936 RepID=A0A0E9R0M2_ANGAN